MDYLPGIAVRIPENVKSGEAARLFPVLNETSRERRAASVFLCTLSIVDTLADLLLRRLGRPIGKRAKVECFTEIILKSDPKFRPDGLIVVDSSKDKWSALVECKVGRAKIEPAQLESYVRIARENNIDCVITISNELVADPKRPPTVVDRRLTRTVSHFHYSWLSIRSEAEVAYAQKLVDDPEQTFILKELIRFLLHPSAGVEGFTQMPGDWAELVGDIGAGRSPKKNDPRVTEIADAWLQEEKELALILSRLVNRRCVSRSEKRLRRVDFDPVDRIATELSESQTLSTEFTVPDAASEIVVRCDLRSRSTNISMTLRAPENRKRPDARLNWLLNQLKNVDSKGVDIVSHWPGRTNATSDSLSALKANPKAISEQNPGSTPYAFEVSTSCHTPAAFVGRRRFIQDLERSIQQFYADIGRHLTAWSPPPPAPAEKTAAAQITEHSQIDTTRLDSIHQSLSRVLQSLGETSQSEASTEAVDTDATRIDSPKRARTDDQPND